VNKREGRSRSRRATLAAVAADEGAGETERAAFRINLKDLRFLKSLGIDPTRKVRNRKVPAKKTSK